MDQRADVPSKTAQGIKPDAWCVVETFAVLGERSTPGISIRRGEKPANEQSAPIYARMTMILA